jgi:hypothetical protein
MNEQDIRLAMLQIRNKLGHSPAAADTAQGIHACWMVWNEPRPHWTVTEQALRRLEKAGEVERVRLEDRREVWRKAQRRGDSG